MTYRKQHRSNLDKIVIFSASLNTLSKEANDVRTKKAKIILNDFQLAYKEVKGVYRNFTEDAFLVVVENDDDLENCLELAKTFNQECVLFSDKDRHSRLIYSNAEEYIGKLQRVNSVEGLESFTIVDGDIWTCL